MSLDDVLRQEAENAAKAAAKEEEQYRLAKQYYEESGCQAYLERITEHLLKLRGPSARISEGRRAVDYRVDLSWHADYHECSISIVATSKGDLIIGSGLSDQFVRLKKWRRNKQMLEAAIADAYRHPSYHTRD